ncbi:MAG: helix-turn-helix domain-containing protein, partial [Ignavibacteriaceae bacterium]
IRVLAATNKDLKIEIEGKRFREDLYYRINVIEIKIPKLSERKEDIPLLIDFFIQKYNKELKKHIIRVDNEVLAALMNYDWKGNLRELENMIERSVLLCNHDVITIKDLPSHLNGEDRISNNYPDDLNNALESYEKQHIINILEKTKGNRSEAAGLLKIDVSTLYRKMVRYSINKSE